MTAFLTDVDVVDDALASPEIKSTQFTITIHIIRTVVPALSRHGCQEPVRSFTEGRQIVPQATKKVLTSACHGDKIAKRLETSEDRTLKIEQ